MKRNKNNLLFLENIEFVVAIHTLIFTPGCGVLSMLVHCGSVVLGEHQFC